ncbi:MAG: glycosyltransferase WbuB [Denitrovibrio sp.]|nr:MAG: glycosyltransferase WbuB [Denitrovibrio sp.]
MKICIVVDDYLPESIKAASKMMHELACEYHKLGHSVTVITPSPFINGKVQVLDIDNINVIKFKTGKIKNVSKVKRLLNEMSLSGTAIKSLHDFIKGNPHDLIVYYSPSIFWGSLVSKLKSEWKCPAYLILRDFFPQWAIDNKIIHEKSLVTKLLKFYEKKSYDAADRIGVMSPKNLEWFQNYYKTDKRLEVLFNWTSEVELSGKSSYRKKLNLEDKVVFFYGCNIGQAQDMMNIVRLADRLSSNEEAFFLLIGEGDEYELVQNAVKERGLKNFMLMPSVSQAEYLEMLSEFDIGLFSLNKHHQTHNFQGKLLMYMVQGKPLLGSINPGNDLKQIVEQYDAGLISINGDDETFYQNALKLMDEEKRLTISRNAKVLLSEKFVASSAAKQVLNCIK